MEREPLRPHRRTIAAARSLHINRRNKEVIEGRIERATDEIMSYLGLAGLTTARLGLYDVTLAGDELELTRLPVAEAKQLELSEGVAGDQDGEPTAYHNLDGNPCDILALANAGILECPCCSQPLAGETFQIGGVTEVRLYCRDKDCGYEEL